MLLTSAIPDLTVQSNPVSIPPGEALAIFDTGLTTIIGPMDVIQSLYEQIPGSQPLGNGTWGFRLYFFSSVCRFVDWICSTACDVEVNTTISFGSKFWSISSADFNVGPADNSTGLCFGAFLGVGGSNSDPTLASWIIGVAFMVSKDLLSISD